MSYNQIKAAGALAITLMALCVQGVKIVVTFPAYDVVLKEAFPNADVILLTKGVLDPHEYQLTVQDVQLLESLGPGDVVISSAHAPFELRIAQLIEQGRVKAKYINLTSLQTYLTWDGKEATLGGPKGPDHAGVNPHDHGLYPPNVLRLVEAVSNATGLRPDSNFVAKLKQLEAEYGGKFSGKAVALTPAAQYLLHWLGYDDVVILVKEPDVPPTAEDLQRAIQYVKEGAPAAAVFVGDKNPRLIQMFTEKAKEAGASPRVAEADFSASYLSTLEKFVESLKQATAPAENKGAQFPAPAAGTSGGTQLILWAVVVLVAVVTVLVLISRRKK